MRRANGDTLEFHSEYLQISGIIVVKPHVDFNMDDEFNPVVHSHRHCEFER